MKGFVTLIVLCLLVSNLNGQRYIANHIIAHEDTLRAIPKGYIDKARNELKIAYEHTSHGTHVSRGMYGLQNYKPGDELLFGITNNNPQASKLEFHDYAIRAYSAPGERATDLSANETAFIQATRNYLDASENKDINVIMWSWCNIAGHDIESNYLPGMELLIEEYGKGGSKIGEGEGKTRVVPVNFVFMTGHANWNNNVGDGKPKNQAEIINNYCKKNKYFCLDYFSIDSHDMDSRHWDDAGDDGNSAKYGGTGKFNQDYQNLKSVGDGYYENKIDPDGEVAYGAHNTQHITANRKAYAMWWILARLAGWNGDYSKDISVYEVKMDDLLYFDHPNKRVVIKDYEQTMDSYCKIYDLEGKLIKSDLISGTDISLSDITVGVYVLVLESDDFKTSKKIVVR